MDKQSYSQALEIYPWTLRKQAAAPVIDMPADADTPAASIPASTAWHELQQEVANCTACNLHCSRTQTVFGVGNMQARLMIVGEAPGFHEDQQGEPFVGRAGQLLTAMLAAIGFERKEVYIANILKCRPPNNRDPVVEEVNTCTPFLQRQLALLQPQVILAVGRIAAHYLLGTKASLESLRNKTHSYGEQKTPLVITYHPAYLLRSPADKAKAYADLRYLCTINNLR